MHALSRRGFLRLKSISNKLSKPKIWRVNPQKIVPTISLIHCSLAKNCLLMNSSFLGLMTYCSLAKELMGIKNSTHLLKYSIFTQQSQRLQNHSRSFLSQTSLNLITIKIQTQITMLILKIGRASCRERVFALV